MERDEMTEIYPELSMIKDACGVWWRFHTAEHMFGSDNVRVDGDDEYGSGFFCTGFRDAVETLLDEGYLDEEYATGWLEAN
jgi:hypothetical protein